MGIDSLKIDLTRKQNIADDERLKICSFIHFAALKEIFLSSAWKVEQVVFHGGTSLGVAYGSPRHSEDLDFMIAADKSSKLDGVMKRIRLSVERACAIHWPGSRLEIKGIEGREPGERMSRYSLKWTHPNRHGKAEVKFEFYDVPDHLLAAYGVARVRVPASEGRIRITSPINVGAIDSIWADKIVAIAKRAYFKERDVFDLWFIEDQASTRGIEISPETASKNIPSIARIYNYSPDEVAAGLQSFLNKPQEQLAECVENDMRRWLERDIYRSYKDAGLFEEMVESARRQAAFALKALEPILDHQGPAAARLEDRHDIFAPSSKVPGPGPVFEKRDDDEPGNDL